jgi:excisionase family DNA binding protein
MKLMNDKLTLEQTAQELRVSPRQLREMAAAGKIGHVRVGRRNWLFTRSDLDRFLQAHRFEPREAIGAKPKKPAK